MRHIPACDTASAGVLTLEEALAPTAADYDRDRWLYVPDHYCEYRYILGTRGSRPLICIGINPSTAVPGRLDNTLKSAERIALHNGFDSFLMFNVYAQRATDPDDLEQDMNPLLHRENLRAFEWLLNGLKETPTLWAAWGTVIERRPWLASCALDMVKLGERFGARWVTAGPRSKAGHPHHPLYLKKDAALDPFTDLAAYLTLLAGRENPSADQRKRR